MKNSSSYTAFALAAACLLASVNLHGKKEPAIAITPTRLAILAGIIGCSYLLTTREADKNFKPRYSIKKIAELKKIFTREYANNLWYLFYDGFIGVHSKKREHSYGALGITAHHLMPLKKAAGNVAFAYGIWKLGFAIDKQIAKLAKHKD